VKFTPSGSIEVRAACLQESDGAALMRFEVRDTGIGIAPDVQGQLFQAFVQADGSTTRKYGGTGLGLAICKRIVEQMGGEIGVESAPGEGSCFWFNVPMRLVATSARDVDITEPAMCSYVPAPYARRLLVVEDSAANQRVAVGLLNKLGYDADVADGGTAALELLQNGEYAAVLMDCQMPDVDGYAATIALRRLEVIEDRRRTPVIALTANAMQGDRERCLAAGMDDYLSKPLRSHELAAMLARWTGSTGADGSVDAALDERINAEINELFRAEAPRSVAAMADAVAEGQHAQIWRTAHRLGSEAALIGAHSLADLCRRLEADAAQEGAHVAQLAERVTEIREAVDYACR
jgi:CheY-like chemotaxis protein/HPt (histidine-containing phosphotransfer) domain-containing protein